MVFFGLVEVFAGGVDAFLGFLDGFAFAGVVVVGRVGEDTVFNERDAQVAEFGV